MDLAAPLTAVYGRPVDYTTEDIGSTLGRGKGDASSRSYCRARVAGAEPSSVVVMLLGAEPLRSDEGGGTEKSTELAFTNVQRCLRSRGLPVPEILLEGSVRYGLLVLEDLGDTTLEASLRPVPREKWSGEYRKAVDLLIQMHDRMQTPDPDCIAYRRSFDRTLLRWELEHYREWGLEARLGVTLTSGPRARLDAAFDALVDRLLALPCGFVHRDFQSRNLMVTDGCLRVIDFQDALLGPRVYDLVSLLCDSYVDVGASVRDRMIEQYAAARGISPAELVAEFHLVALHRKLKDSGRFIFIDRVKKNPSFVRHIPQSIEYVRRSLVLAEGASDLASALRECASQDFP